MSDHPTCKTCGHWGRGEIQDRYQQYGLKGCCAVPEIWTTIDNESEKQLHEFANITAFAEDGENYYAVIQTRENHYCSMHSELDK